MRITALSLLALVATGCGSSARYGQHGVVSKPSDSVPCQAAKAPDTVVCGYPLDSKTQSSIWLGPEGHRTKVAGPARIALAGVPAQPIKNAGPAGFWVHNRVFRSPDGRTFLAQWSGECENQSTYFLGAHGGKPRSVFVSESTALGWSKDGRARVSLAEPGFGAERGYRSGIYLVEPRTMKRTLIRAVDAKRGC